MAPKLRRYQPGDENRIDQPDAAAAGWLLDFLSFWHRYHRYSVDGLEHVPKSGGALIASYHSFTIVDMLLLGREIYLRDGRIVRGLTDKLILRIPVLQDLAATLGIVSGTPANGLALLESGQLAGCMPGGGLEWSRSTAQRRVMRWGDHRGYARLAIRAGVPVIPTACPAADSAFIVPWDGWKLGAAVQKLLGTSRNVPLPFGIGLLGPLAFPVKLTQRVAAPIWPEDPPSAADDPAAVQRLDARVRGALRELLAQG